MVGFFAKLFGTEVGDSDKRMGEERKICAKCGQPIPRENLAFDSGGGRPIHRICPEATSEASEP